ncbi:MAG: acyl-ACP--UDP-N-acetylglucosamine O-acyltransferase [Ignavibacteriales bacterium]|nr:MAG: acyl-ACP--UDP-N-acetylglucosamine O-acyltransferase [Ignavibacteriales bacterium]
MVTIHPTAIVSPNAKLGNNVKVGPFSIIHDDVEIGDDSIIDSHAVLYDGARLGNHVRIFQGVSVANVPQDLKFGNEKTFFYIGDNTQIREFVTLHRGTRATGKSIVGKNCLLMAYCHIAHDCVVGDNVIMANSVHLGGHVEIENNVIIGGLAGVHQFSKIGAHAMVGTHSKITSDVPPFLIVHGVPARFEGINKVGLKRRGFSAEQLEAIKEAYRIIYLSGLLFSDAKIRIAKELGHHEVVKQILDFISRATRGIVRK